MFHKQLENALVILGSISSVFLLVLLTVQRQLGYEHKIMFLGERTDLRVLRGSDHK